MVIKNYLKKQKFNKKNKKTTFFRQNRPFLEKNLIKNLIFLEKTR